MLSSTANKRIICSCEGKSRNLVKIQAYLTIIYNLQRFLAFYVRKLHKNDIHTLRFSRMLRRQYSFIPESAGMNITILLIVAGLLALSAVCSSRFSVDCRRARVYWESARSGRGVSRPMHIAVPQIRVSGGGVQTHHTRRIWFGFQRYKVTYSPLSSVVWYVLDKLIPSLSQN